LVTNVVPAFVEVHTATGQLLEIECASGDEEKIKDLFGQVVCIEVKEAATKEVLIGNGEGSFYTRYNVTQLDHARDERGYLEVLKIKNSPDGRCGNVVHKFSYGAGHEVFEFESIEAAREAFKCTFGQIHRSGLIRHFQCGWLQPWFYAVGDQFVVGDVVFPNVFSEEDSVFRVGRKFVVADCNGDKTIKICLGSRLVDVDRGPFGGKKKYLCVQWFDGSQWYEYSASQDEWPQPLDEVVPSVAAALNINLGIFLEFLDRDRQSTFTLSLSAEQELLCVISNKQTNRRKRR
jgi:hypothetical protein